MEDVEKVKAYVELGKIQMDRFNKRRDIEWKVTILIWTGIFVLTGFLAGKAKMELADLFLYAAIWIIFSFGWTPGLWMANETDKQYAEVYLNRVELLIGHTCIKKKFEKPRRFGFLRNWSRLSQIIVTGILLFFSWCFLTRIPV